MVNLFKIIFLTFTFASSEPFVFDENTYTKPPSKLFFVKFLKADSDVGLNQQLRFCYLIPKFGAEFKDGFECRRNRVLRFSLNFLKPDNDEHFFELILFSDRKTWNSTLLGLWGQNGLYYKGFTTLSRIDGFKNEVTYHNTLDPVVDYVFNNARKEDFQKLVKEGLPSHMFTHMVFEKFRRV